MNGGDTRYHDRHQDSQDDQEDQECPPSTRVFLITLFARNTHVSFFLDHHQEDQEDQEYPPSTRMFVMALKCIIHLMCNIFLEPWDKIH